MAGDWVKMRCSLSTDPKVASIARVVGAAGGEELASLSRSSLRLLVIGGLHAVWAAANEHASAGLMKGMLPEDLDDIAGLAGLGAAMVEVGWAVETSRGIMLPNFTEWNRPADDRTNAERQKRHRERVKTAEIPEGNGTATGRNGTVTRYVTDSNGVIVTTEKRREEKRDTHTHTAGEPRVETGEPPAEPGWALDEWTRFAASWNATERAEPWRHLTPPDGWADLAAAPGWLQRAREALDILPSRRFFDRPLPVTRFFEYIDRIRAGEFADPKEPRSGRAVAVAGKAPRRGNL